LPDDATQGWGPGTVVFDTVYNPLETKLLRDGKAAGCVTIPGAEMFVRQGAAQFKLWTGADAPVSRLRELVVARLSS
jgi:shikimate 5-dehydrogenase